MDDDQLLRYSRHIMLKELGYPGQLRLLDARVLILGIGGLGSPAAMYLAASGIGHLVLVDFDTVDASNLQRQIAFNTHDIGDTKVEAAAKTLVKMNPDIDVRGLHGDISIESLASEISAADVVLDCTDNFNARDRINELCVQSGTPLVSGAAIRFDGQISVFDPRLESSPCYRCLYPEGTDEDDTCSNRGILSPVVGIIGSAQAVEALKLLTSIGETLCGRLLILDALRMEWRSIQLHRDPNCPVCSRQGSRTTTRSF
ncbi:HesA/MoeB/ThiF family protein [Acidihalobacter prosperus]